MSVIVYMLAGGYLWFGAFWCGMLWGVSDRPLTNREHFTALFVWPWLMLIVCREGRSKRRRDQ